MTLQILDWQSEESPQHVGSWQAPGSSPQAPVSQQEPAAQQRRRLANWQCMVIGSQKAANHNASNRTQRLTGAEVRRVRSQNKRNMQSLGERGSSEAAPQTQDRRPLRCKTRQRRASGPRMELLVPVSSLLQFDLTTATLIFQGPQSGRIIRPLKSPNSNKSP